MPADDILSPYATPTTLLQAVNVVLGAIGQTAVASLEASQTNVSAQQALNRIGEALRETLEEGWHFNTLPAFIIQPNGDNFIKVPAGTLRAEQAWYPGTWNQDLVQLGDRMFDRKSASYVIKTPVCLNLTVMRHYEECPEPFRWYIALRAARRAAAQSLISSTAYNFTKADEDVARLRMEQADADTAGRNLRNNPHVRRMRRK